MDTPRCMGGKPALRVPRGRGSLRLFTPERATRHIGSADARLGACERAGYAPIYPIAAAQGISSSSRRVSGATSKSPEKLRDISREPEFCCEPSSGFSDAQFLLAGGLLVGLLCVDDGGVSRVSKTGPESYDGQSVQGVRRIDEEPRLLRWRSGTRRCLFGLLPRKTAPAGPA